MTHLKNEDAVLYTLPALQEVCCSGRLGDYFTKKTRSLTHVSRQSVEFKLMKQVLFEEIQRLYGSKTAEEACEQLTDFPVVETGTHLAFLRDSDGPHKPDLRTRLNQNVLISAALMRQKGCRYHIGIYGSNVTLNHSCSGGYFQLGPDIFPVTFQKNINQHCLYQAEAIDDAFFNPTLVLIVKLRMLNAVLNEVQETPMEMLLIQKIKRITEQLLGPVKDFKTAYKSVQDQYNNLNAQTRAHLENTLKRLEPQIKAKFGYTYTDIEKQYAVLNQVFQQKDLSLADQVALVQSNMISQLIEPAGIRHISIDAVDVARQFFVRALKEPSSYWHRLFSNPVAFKRFQKAFVGIRSSWKEDESPFDFVFKKQFTKIKSLALAAFEHSAEKTAELLQNKEIVPSSALMMLAFQSAGVLAHGGFFQTTYAKEIQRQFQVFLKTQNEPLIAEQVAPLESDLVLLSLSVLNNEANQPLKLSDIARFSENDRRRLMDMIPYYSAEKAVRNALPTLSAYLDLTAPGYIKREIDFSTENLQYPGKEGKIPYRISTQSSASVLQQQLMRAGGRDYSN